jgi:hypothetical protein
MMQPPRLPRWLLGVLVSGADRALFLGDIDEEFASRAESRGIRAARRWYWRQLMSSIAPLAWHRITRTRDTVPISHGDAMWRDILNDSGTPFASPAAARLRPWR